MAKSRVVIFGSGGHAKVIVDIIESNDDLELIGFIDTNKTPGDECLGYKVIGNENSMTKLMKEFNFIKGVVGIGDNYLRSKVVNTIKSFEPNFRFINCIHKSANISNHCEIGVGNVVMPGVTINAETTISDHCFLNTNSSIDHECRMENFSSIAPNSVLGGNCSIEEFSYVGIGASVFHRVNIGYNCIIGGGSLVNQNTLPNSVYYGVPARFVSFRNIGDSYF